MKKVFSVLPGIDGICDWDGCGDYGDYFDEEDEEEED